MTTTSPELPYDRRDLSLYTRKVYAHYMPEFMPPTDAGGPVPSSSVFDVEIKKAWDAGIDGFIMDCGDFPSGHWVTNRVNAMASAAQRQGKFKVIPLIDLATVSVFDAPGLAARLRPLLALPSVEDQVWFWIYDVNRPGLSYWQSLAQNLPGIKSVALFVNMPTDLNPYKAFCYSVTSWGGGSWSDSAKVTLSGQASRIKSLVGDRYIAPAKLQDVRPASHIFWESTNSLTLRKTMESAIDNGARVVHIPTWNDLREGSQIRDLPWLDVLGYWVIRLKSGTWPQIVRNAAYLTSRNQIYKSASGMSVGAGSIAPVNKLELLTFLTRAAGGGVYAGDTLRRPLLAAPGFQASTFPLGTGVAPQAEVILTQNMPRVNVKASGIVSPTLVNSDLRYKIVSSLR